MNKVIIIAGPTAVGKTSLGLKLAHLFNTDIISGDAYQVYRRMDIGTAKPKLEEREGVVHHLMDIIEPFESFSVADFQKRVRAKIDEMTARGKLPIIVGGSGLYIDSVIYDYQFLGPSRNEEADLEFSELNNQAVHELLSKLDPLAAESIHPNNRKRVLRAIELARGGYLHGDNLKGKTPVYDALIIFLNDDRNVLYEKINQRVDEMIAGGLINEAEKLFPEPLSLQASEAIGYHELFAFFRGEVTLAEAIESIKKDTRHYAKRQLTWFRNRSDVINVMINRYHFDETVNDVCQKILTFLKKEE
jgi:tRNA dimethylallyltransferase